MKKTISWIAALIAAVILLQTLYFKFTAQPESVYIFSKLGLEPYGRIGSGVSELLAGILLLIPRTRIWGALLGLGIISGAIVSHLFVLGIEVQNDGGQLFFLALAVFISCFLIVFMQKEEVINKFKAVLKL
ncbi:MAG: DoxX family protein [Saprospiraceae bacterium]|nr:DoxX family protein [Saprospiraceae bacterium]